MAFDQNWREFKLNTSETYTCNRFSHRANRQTDTPATIPLRRPFCHGNGNGNPHPPFSSSIVNVLLFDFFSLHKLLWWVSSISIFMFVFILHFNPYLVSWWLTSDYYYQYYYNYNYNPYFSHLPPPFKFIITTNSLQTAKYSFDHVFFSLSF